MELSREQLNQQDYVDNAIMNLIYDLVPDTTSYDGEIVGEIRDALITHYNLPDGFYPSVEDDDKPTVVKEVFQITTYSDEGLGDHIEYLKNEILEREDVSYADVSVVSSEYTRKMFPEDEEE